jgi:hypothetical protein
VGKQGKVVPCPLERGEPLPVFDDSRHPLQQLLCLLSHKREPRDL